MNCKPEKLHVWTGDIKSRQGGSGIQQGKRKAFENLCVHAHTHTLTHIPLSFPNSCPYIGKGSPVSELDRWLWSGCHLAAREPMMVWSQPRMNFSSFPGAWSRASLGTRIPGGPVELSASRCRKHLSWTTDSRGDSRLW